MADNNTPPLAGGVPIIGQPVYAYKLGHVQIGMPIDPNQALANFDLYQRGGGQLDVPWIMLFTAAVVEAAQLRQALVDLHNRVLELEARAGIVTAESAAAQHVPTDAAGDDDETEARLQAEAEMRAELELVASGLLPDWAQKAVAKPKRCVECGCTEEDCSKCIAKTGEPCHWVAPGLCSACALYKDVPVDDGDYPAAEREEA